LYRKKGQIVYSGTYLEPKFLKEGGSTTMAKDQENGITTLIGLED
jgi:hypothetical protein